MTHRKVSTIICLAALAFTAGGVHNASAQKGVMFVSQGAWVTKDLASSKKGAAPYCVAAMQFSKGTILTMAENKSGEISMAFDFGGGYFDPSALASIILDPGAGQQREFKVKPRSSKAIVVKLGDDKGFMEALSRTGLLRMELGGQSLNFNLENIDVGRKRLSACLDGVIVVSAPNAVPPPNQDLRSLNVENSSTYTNMQDKYERRILALEAKMSGVNVAPDLSVAAAPAALLVPVGVMPMKLPSLNDGAVANVNARAEFSALQGQINILKGKLAVALAEKNIAQQSQMRVSNQVAQEQVSLGKEKDLGKMFAAENEALRAQLVHSEVSLKGELAASNARQTELRGAYDLAQASLLAANNNVIKLQSELVNSRADVMKKLAASDLKSKNIDQKFSALLVEKQKIVGLEAENQHLKNTMLEVEQDYKGLLSKSKGEYANLRSEHDLTVASLTRVSGESAALKKLLGQVEELQEKAKTASLSDAQQLEEQFASLLEQKEKIVSVDAENNVLEGQVKVLENSMRQQLASADLGYKQLENTYNLTKGNLELATKKIAELKGELVAVDIENQRVAAIEGDDVGAQDLVAAKKSAIALEADNVSLRAQVESFEG